MMCFVLYIYNQQMSQILPLRFLVFAIYTTPYYNNTRTCFFFFVTPRNEGKKCVHVPLYHKRVGDLALCYTLFQWFVGAARAGIASSRASCFTIYPVLAHAS